MRKQYLVFLSVLSLFFSCSNDGVYTPDGGEGEEGEVVLHLSANAGNTGIQIGGMTKTGDTEPQLDIQNFRIQVLNAAQRVVKEWARYADMPATVRLNAATYTLRAFYGEDPLKAGFGLPYFLGEQTFKLAGQQTQQVSLVCKLHNSKIAVAFGENINRDYKDFRMEVVPVANPSQRVTFNKGETRSAYVPAGDLQLKIYMVDPYDEVRVYMPANVTVVSQDFMTIKIDSKSMQGSLSMTLVTKTETEDKEVTTDVPTWMLPKAAPVFTFDLFDAQTGELSYVEGVPQAALVHLRADGMIKSCVVHVSDNLKALGWPDGFDLAGSLPEGTRSLLQSKGLSWLETMKGEGLANINFTGVADQLISTLNQVNTYGFTVTVTDSYDQVMVRTVNLKVNPPRFTLNAVTDKDAWASKVEHVTIDISAGNPDRVMVQYKTASDEWVDCVTSERRVTGGTLSLTAQSIPTRADAPQTIGLRARYNTYYSNEVTVTLEAAMQVPNSNFEVYCEYKQNSNTKKAQYYWYASQGETDRWWATRNLASTSQTGGLWTGEYSTNNGTSPVDNPISGNGKAVQIKTTGWGQGNTQVGGGSVVYNVTAGLLFIGDYTCSVGSGTGGKLNSENIAQGRPFTSRPARFQFQYMYQPYGGDSFDAYAVVEGEGGIELGRATATEINASVQGVMTNVSFDFQYDPANKSVKATTIKVFFSSSKTQWTDWPPYNKGSDQHGGSVLTVDNLNLDYNF